MNWEYNCVFEIDYSFLMSVDVDFGWNLGLIDEQVANDGAYMQRLLILSHIVDIKSTVCIEMLITFDLG